MIVFSQISIADLKKVVRVFEMYKAIDVKVDLTEYPHLKSLKDRVMSEPELLPGLRNDHNVHFKYSRGTHDKITIFSEVIH